MVQATDLEQKQHSEPATKKSFLGNFGKHVFFYKIVAVIVIFVDLCFCFFFLLGKVVKI